MTDPPALRQYRIVVMPHTSEAHVTCLATSEQTALKWFKSVYGIVGTIEYEPSENLWVLDGDRFVYAAFEQTP